MDKKPLLAIVIVLGILTFGGCASTGNERIASQTQATVSSKLVRGKTTENEVRKLYGDPMKVSFTDSGNEIWEYDFTKMHDKAINFIPLVNILSSGEEGKKKTLMIFFDKGKVLQNYSLSSSAVDTSTGILRQ
ncbi:MAG TPA: hypothetical protein DEP05_07640 [Betaproteobacteria bacterium]|nr:hypothetical protein [Betaproteobacteria bacterium]